jgi:hypothetical protein
MTEVAKLAKLNWPNILWREWTWCQDDDYARRLYESVSHGPASWLTRWRIRGQARPYAHQVEAALWLACADRGAARFIWEARLARLSQAKQKPAGPQTLIARLADHHWFERFLARHLLLHWAGAAIEPLWALSQSDETERGPVAAWLVASIAAATTERLATTAEGLICTDCLVTGYGHRLNLAGQRDITYYGCRRCRQSHSLVPKEKSYVVVLESGPKPRRLEQADQVRVNGFQHPDLFDFDRVEIIAASDEQVERFAVQVGNDTDPVRPARYRTLPCLVSASCTLSENTLKILARTFAEVRVV